MKQCAQCGYPNPDGQADCFKCNEPLRQPAATPEPQQPAPARPRRIIRYPRLCIAALCIVVVISALVVRRLSGREFLGRWVCTGSQGSVYHLRITKNWFANTLYVETDVDTQDGSDRVRAILDDEALTSSLQGKDLRVSYVSLSDTLKLSLEGGCLDHCEFTRVK